MRFKLLSLVAIAGLSGLIANQFYKPNTTVQVQKFSPRAEKQDIQNSPHTGGNKYVASLRGDFKTGIVDPEMVYKAEQQILNNSSRAGGIGLEFEFMGPENYGGRTRGIVVDKDNNKKIYAAAITGGVYISNNGGNNWIKSWEHRTNNVSCITQSTNGTLYVGTGSTFEGTSGNAPDGDGRGIYTSTNGGETWTLMSNTTGFSYVNEIMAHPTDANTIAAATWNGLYITTDGGATWSNTSACRQNTSIAVNRALDVDWSIDGKSVFCAFSGGSLYYGSDYTTDCGLTAVAGVGTGGRWAISVSPSNADVIYAITTQGGGYIDTKSSTDGGATWTSFNPPMPVSAAHFDLFGDNGGGQAEYDLMFLATPRPGARGEDNLWVGGVDVWRFDGNWTQAANRTSGGQSGESFRMHVDHHSMTFDPSNPSVLYFGNDGGMYKSLDGGLQFYEINKGYTTTQYYEIAHANYDYVVGGLQDNGIIFVTPFRPGNPTYGASVFNQGVLNGDGFATVVSQVADLKYTSSQHGNVGRGGISSTQGSGACVAYCGMSNFVSHLGFWESTNDLTSRDSIAFVVDTTEQNVGLGTGNRTTFQGTLEVEQNAAKIIPGSIKIGTIDDILVYDGKGGFTGPGFGTLDSTDYTFTVTFDKAPNLNSRVNAFFTVSYEAGSLITVASATDDIPIQHVLKTNLEPGDVLKIQDPVQSIISQPTNNRCNTQTDGSVVCQDPNYRINDQSYGGNGSNQRGLIMARKALVLGENPEWIHLNVGNVNRHVFSDDGNDIYFANGSELRFLTGVNNLYTQADVDKIAPALDPNQPNGQYNAYPSKRVLSAAGRISGIDINPKNPNELLVSVSNYGSVNHVYLVTRIPNTDNFTSVSIQGDLPDLPVYDVIYDADNPDQAILGTDLGIFTSTNIRAGSVEWVSEADENSLHMIPVFDVDQQVLGYKEATNSGMVYAGTHGQGVWKSSTIVGLDEISHKNFDSDINSDITIYPNPLNQSGRMQVRVGNPENVSVAIYDISGQLRKTLNPYLELGDNDVSFDVSDLNSGTYFMILTDGTTQKVAKFVKMK